MAREIKNILINAIRDSEMKRCVSSGYLTGSLIDIGCGTKPYKDLLAPCVSQHIGIEHPATQHSRNEVDVFGTAYSIPVAGNTFQSAICNAVLEHLEEPKMAVQECHRVLKPGGIAVYTMPFMWHVHEEPRDFYRLTRFGLQYVFEQAGFEIVEIKAMSGFWVTFGQLLTYNAYRLNRGPLRTFHIIDAIGLMLQFVAYVLNMLDRTEQWTWAYMVVAKKKTTG
jgi:SAM-dependent methyltransferase